ncbi:GlxA family transcriptional regulator [Flavobacterium sp.]|uniref:GlxA family transcriptional regulator n=1 Tax=Flavobacterium sp. TaxID=239 RepID=UPI003D6C1D78
MKLKFVFLILPQIHLMDLAGPDQAILEAIDFGADFEIEYCTMENNVVTTSGLPIANLKHFSEVQLNKGDFLIIPGSNASYLISDAFIKQTDLFQWIIANYNFGVKVVSICAGAFVLAECGLLNNLPCTTHFKRTKQLQELYPQAKVIDNILFTQQDGIYTSAGIASGIDVTLHIIEELKGSHFAHLVARELVVYNRRNGNQKQESELLGFRNHIHSGIHKAQDWIIENINQKTNLNDLAEIACMSERNFTRIFKKETDITVNDYITIIRKEKIKEFLKNPDLTRLDIALQVGLQSERQLSRLIHSN